ncbi:MAG: antirestriction protein [Gammaproteobacteria bacterium]
MTTTIITRTQAPDHLRIQHTAKLFGLNFPLHLEPLVYTITGNIASDYNGGYWEFYELSNGGFYMAPDSDNPFKVSCENGFEGQLSADALGITVCLYAYSLLSFTGKNGFDETCARQYHLLRDYMLEQPDDASKK